MFKSWVTDEPPVMPVPLYATTMANSCRANRWWCCCCCCCCCCCQNRSLIVEGASKPNPSSKKYLRWRTSPSCNSLKKCKHQERLWGWGEFRARVEGRALIFEVNIKRSRASIEGGCQIREFFVLQLILRWKL